MPDEWEKKHGLAPNKNDAADYDLSEDFTNVEMYLNDLVKHS